MRAATLPLLAVLLAAPAWAQDDEVKRLDALFERVEQVAKHRLLLTQDGGSFRMTEKTFAAHGRLWPFVKKGDRIHLTTKRGWVLKVEKGWKTEASRKSALIAKLERAQAGDRVLINGRPFLFAAYKNGVVQASPKLPGGDFGYAGEELISLGSIETFEPAPAEERSAIDLAEDTLQIFKVEVGDTVDIKLHGSPAPLRGAVAALSPVTCELLQWKNGAWGERRLIPRPQVEQVTHVWLEGRLRQRLEDGELRVEISRFRRGAVGPLELKLEVVHDAPGVLLDGLTLELHLRDGVGGGASAGVDTVSIPPLLPRKPHRFAYEASLVTAVDFELQLSGQRPLAFHEPGARAPLLAAIGAGAPLSELREFYRGLARSGQRDVLELVLSRALYPPARSGERAEDHTAVAVAALAEAGDRALEAAFEAIEGDDSTARMTTLDGGELVVEPFPDAAAAGEHRKRLLRLLPELPGALEGAWGRRLFTLHRARSELTQAIEQAFAARPEQSTPLLLELAVPAERGVPQERTDAAAAILRGLGRLALDPLAAALEARGLDRASFVQARSRYEADQAHRAVEAALEVARAGRDAVWRAALDEQVKEATALGRGGQKEEAVAALRAVLAADAKHAQAREALAEIVQEVASAKEADGLPGEAALMLEEVVADRPAVRGPLARLILKGLEQDLGTVAVRARPHVAAVRISVVGQGKRLHGEAVSVEWVEVESEVGTGYVYRACLEPSGSSFEVTLPRTPALLIERGVARIKELDAALAGEADAILGRFCALEGERLAAEGKYGEAVQMYSRAADLVPDDPRLSGRTSAWIRANLTFLLLLGVGLAVVAGGVAAVVVKTRKEARAREAELTSMQNPALRIDLFESDMGVTVEEEGAQEGEPGSPPPGE